MKKLLITISFCFLFVACGHSSSLLEDSKDEVAAPATSASENFDWHKARVDASPTTDARNSSSATTTISSADTFTESAPANPLDAYIQEFVSFAPGTGSNFGESSMSEWLLGPPFGGGKFVQSADVVSLGNGGEIILSFPRFFPIDKEGPDFIVFENAFTPRGSDELFMEPGIVSASKDGIHFTDFPCQISSPYTGCAATHAVLANPDYNVINPRDPNTAGGDAYDLNDIGFTYAKYIRIRDSGLVLAGSGATGTGQAGFDLDAIAIVHGAKP